MANPVYAVVPLEHYIALCIAYFVL